MTFYLGLTDGDLSGENRFLEHRLFADASSVERTRCPPDLELSCYRSGVLYCCVHPVFSDAARHVRVVNLQLRSHVEKWRTDNWVDF